MFDHNLLLISSFFAIILSCSDSESQLSDIEKIIPGREIATGVSLTYTDSARLKFRILTPRLETYTEEDMLVEEYPFGLSINFYDDEKNITSSIKAKYAKRISKQGTMTLRDSVVLVNGAGDKLITRGIVWDELNHSLKTNKFVELIKVASRDTFFGFGFYARDDFSKFKIIQMKGKRRYQNLVKELGLQEGS